jgi:hypothetical protein
MKSKTPSNIGTNEYSLHIAWGPDAAVRAGDVSRTSRVSATIAQDLLAWLSNDLPGDLDPKRTNFMVQSFLTTMHRIGWDPHVPATSSQPLTFGLLQDGALIEVVVRVTPKGVHLLRFERGDPGRN